LTLAGFSDVKIEELFLPEDTEPISPDISDAAAQVGTRIHDLPMVSAIFARI
jgi:hypothetical protein